MLYGESKSGRAPRLLADNCGELFVSIDLAQLDLSRRDQAEEQHQCGVLARERALRFHSPAEFAVEPLDDVGRADVLPLLLREAIHREELVASFFEALHHAGAAAPRSGCWEARRRPAWASASRLRRRKSAHGYTGNISQHRVRNPPIFQWYRLDSWPGARWPDREFVGGGPARPEGNVPPPV